MKNISVNIDFRIMAKALKEYVRKSAILAGNTIVYKKSGELIEENPKTTQVKILQRIH